MWKIYDTRYERQLQPRADNNKHLGGVYDMLSMIYEN